MHKEHALIHDGAAGQAGHIGAVAGLLEHAAHDVQAAVKLDALAYLGGLFDEALPDGGHTVPCLLAHGVGVYRHLAPCQKLQPLLAGDYLEQLHGLCPQVLILGEEEHSHAVLPLVAQPDVQFLGYLGEELVADLQQDAHAIAGLALGVLTGAVLQPLHNGQRIVHGLVTFASLDVHHSADAAGIVLKLWVVQTKGGFLLCKVFHSLSHPFYLFAYRGLRHPPQLFIPCKKKKAPRKGRNYPCGTPLFRYLILYRFLKNLQVTAAPNLLRTLRRFLCETPRAPAAVRSIQTKPPHPALCMRVRRFGGICSERCGTLRIQECFDLRVCCKITKRNLTRPEWPAGRLPGWQWA